MGLLDRLFGVEAVQRIFSDRARLQGMLDFEAALARAEARAGLIPSSAVAPILAKCRAATDPHPETPTDNEEVPQPLAITA